MRLFLSLSAATVLAVLVLTACNSREQGNTTASANQGGGAAPASTPAAAPTDNVRRITTVELKNAMDKGQVVVIDVRSSSAYEGGHIKGSLSIPTGELLSKVDQLPRDKMIVTYCS